MLVVVALVGTACAQGIDGRVNLDVGDQIRVSITSHCGLETLEIDINEQTWTTETIPQDAAGNAVEPAWTRTGGVVEMELTLVDEDTLSATEVGSGVFHEYSPNSNPDGCA